jgi:hypothetical protein
MNKCEICDQVFKNKRNLLAHQNKKNKCNVTTPYQCQECKKYFKYNCSLKEHTIKQVCKSDSELFNKNKNDDEDCDDNDEIDYIINDKNITNDDKIILIKKITKLDDSDIRDLFNINIPDDKRIKLIKKMDKQKMVYHTSNINNGTINENSHNNITNNIQINNFGQENLSYMDNDYFKNLIMNQHIEKGYIQLIKDIYLNKDHPENATVKVENINNKYAHVYKNGKWAAILKADLKEQLHKKNYTILKMHYDKLKKTMTIPKKEETRVFLQRDDFSDPHMMYVIDKIILLFYNDGEGDDGLLETGKITKTI